MRIRSPTSRASINLRFSPFDIAVAALSPYLALHLRSAQVLSSDEMMVAAYCLLSFVFALIAFSIFRIEGTIPRYISVDDALNIGKAVLLADLMTGIVLFTFTRLDGIPRSVPTIHALILGAGLVGARGLARFLDRRRDGASRPRPATGEHAILVGLNDQSVFWIKYLDACVPGRHRIVGLLDPEPRWIGRSVHGVRVFGPPLHLRALIEEFATHGVRIGRVLVSEGSGTLLARELEQIRHVCAERRIELTSLRDLLGDSIATAFSAAATTPTKFDYRTDVKASTYFRRKGRIEFVVAMALLVVLSPLWLFAALLAFLDVGSPTLFWQQRIGLHGRDFQLYKIRTLRPAFDRHGGKIREEQRLSWIGRLLRHSRLDELPQLLNVLVGDMSLVGPRPLLAEDQPADCSVRLMVRPGITGWAQVNGGALLSPEEKNQLDVWYVRNASLWLDLRIIAMTLGSLLRGDQRSDKLLAASRGERAGREAAITLESGAPVAPGLGD
jgi:lipopolysaccharide/colanic/teichoic acid biosynthesis glycosyltransferase